MKTNYFYLLAVVAQFSYSQESTVSSGGTITSETRSFSYTVGSTNYLTINGERNTITQGIQQPFVIEVTTNAANKGIQLEEASLVQATVYPNPTVSSVVLQVEENNLSDISYLVANSNGIPLVTEKVTQKSSTIDLQKFPSATYTVTVYRGEEILKSFKIIKN